MSFPLLKLGSTGKAVLAVEKRLAKLGYLDAPPNQRFGEATRAAVRAFKQDHGWDDPKPVVGKKMANALGLQGADGFDEGQGPQKALKGGSYNCLVHRDPKHVGDIVKGIVKRNDLDFLQLQEISTYHKVLNDIPGYKLITFPGSKDHGESGVLVRDGVEAKFKQKIEASTPWKSNEGDPRQPRAAVSVRLAGWLRVASVHAPPAVDFVNGEGRGGPERVKSYEELTHRLLAAAKRQAKNDNGVAMLIGGDWNEGTRSTGVGSPHWLAQQAGMKMVSKRPIDWEMIRGARITDMKVGGNFGSDHKLITFTVRRNG